MSQLEYGHASSGTPGLDEILLGGLPTGRPSLLTGPPGSGKTLLSTAFACRALDEGAVAVYASFEEHPEMLTRHAAFLGYDLKGAVAEDRFRVLDMRPGYEELASTGNLDLGPVRTRIEHAITKTGAGRLVLDSIDSLFSIFGARTSTQRELLRLLDWTRDNDITTVLTSFHQTESGLSTHLELIPHVCDCIISVNQVVQDNVMTRHLRVVKYRGSSHGTNVYPFIIDKDGLFVLPITSTRLGVGKQSGYLSTGVSELDEMLDRRGFKRGSVIQISGRTGTGKTLLAASIVQAACESGLRALYVSFEESTFEMLENLKSVGNDLSVYLEDTGNKHGGKLNFEPVRAVELSLEGHLVHLTRMYENLKPDLIVLDPVSSLREQGTLTETKSAVLRLVNHLKERGVTLVFTELLPDYADEHSNMNISSIVDTWIRLRMIESNGEFARLLHVAKSRGIRGSKQVREFHITPEGLNIEMPYIGPGEMVVGTAKKVREQDEARQKQRLERRLENLRKQLSIQQRMLSLQQQLEEVRDNKELESLRQEIESLENQLDDQSRSRNFVRSKRLDDQPPHESNP